VPKVLSNADWMESSRPAAAGDSDTPQASMMASALAIGREKNRKYPRITQP
jgi:hypothetical protein